MENKLTKYCHIKSSIIGYINHISESHFKNIKLGYQTVSKGFVVSDAVVNGCFTGGVFKESGDPVHNSFPHNGFTQFKRLKEALDFGKATYVDKEIIYLGNLRNHFGHLIVDSISRLWYALDNPKKYYYVYSLTAPYSGRNYHENIWRCLMLFGIEREQVIIVDTITQFKKIIIPDCSFVPYEYFTKEYLQIINRIRSNIKESENKYDKVYFSRYNFSCKNKNEFGEKAIVKLMQQNGFHIVYPEECTLDQQISYVYNCKVFASIAGSLAHNIIFANLSNKPDVIIFRRLDGYQLHQYMINEMVGIPITYVDIYSEPFKWLIGSTSISGPYYYSINKYVKAFARDFGLKRCKGHRFIAFCEFGKYALRVTHLLLHKIKIRQIIKND